MLRKKTIAKLTLAGSVAWAGLFAGAAEARLTNCSARTSGRQAYASCSGVNHFLAPYGNQVVVVTICVKAWWLGGGSYQLTGDWVPRNHTSLATCAANYNATSATYWLR